MQNPGSGFFSMVSCLSSSNANVLAAQDITDVFNFKQRSVLFKKTSRSVLSGFKNRGEAESFFKHDNTRLQVFRTASKSLISIDQLILALIFRFGVYLV